jgi:hypothetical protein
MGGRNRMAPCKPKRGLIHGKPHSKIAWNMKYGVQPHGTLQTKKRINSWQTAQQNNSEYE